MSPGGRCRKCGGLIEVNEIGAVSHRTLGQCWVGGYHSAQRPRSFRPKAYQDADGCLLTPGNVGWTALVGSVKACEIHTAALGEKYEYDRGKRVTRDDFLPSEYGLGP